MNYYKCSDLFVWHAPDAFQKRVGYVGDTPLGFKRFKLCCIVLQGWMAISRLCTQVRVVCSAKTWVVASCCISVLVPLSNVVGQSWSWITVCMNLNNHRTDRSSLLTKIVVRPNTLHVDWACVLLACIIENVAYHDTITSSTFSRMEVWILDVRWTLSLIDTFESSATVLRLRERAWTPLFPYTVNVKSSSLPRRPSPCKSHQIFFTCPLVTSGWVGGYRG